VLEADEAGMAGGENLFMSREGLGLLSLNKSKLTSSFF